MHLSCRLGIHSWGKWSSRWHVGYVYTTGGTPYRYSVWQSLKCRLCNKRKDKKVDDDFIRLPVGTTDQPVWED
jgi:hypothetical protein